MPEWKIGLSWALSVTILLLTLAVWMFFYFENMALDAAGTAVVALGMTVLVVAGRWAWTRARRSPEAHEPEVKK